MVHRFFERILEIYIPRIDKYLEAVGDSIDMIQVNDDPGYAKGSSIQPRDIQENAKTISEKVMAVYKTEKQ